MLWDDAYKIGVKEIDDQHIQWIQIIENMLSTVLTGANKQKIIDILNDALQYSEKHFKYEEKLLKLNNYTGLKHHMKLHSEMAAYIKQIIDNVVNDDYTASDTSKMCDNFVSWLITHIEIEDKKYIPFVKTKIKA